MSTIRLFNIVSLTGLLVCAPFLASAGPILTPEVTLNFGTPFGAGGKSTAPKSFGFDQNGQLALLSHSSLTGIHGFDFGVSNTASADFLINKLTLNFHFNGLVKIVPQTGPDYASFTNWTAPSGFVNGNSDIVLSWQPGAAYIGESVQDFNNPGTFAPAFAELTVDSGLTSSADLTTFQNDPNTVTALAEATPEPGVFGLLGGLLAASWGYWARRRRNA